MKPQKTKVITELLYQLKYIEDLLHFQRKMTTFAVVR